FMAGNKSTIDTTGAIVGSRWKFDSTSTTTSGTMSSKMVLTPDQVAALAAGSWYYIYTTKAHRAGEIRGQITATQGPQGNQNH
ncbi:MAG TPA: CHRD domain-containing protein, partial [Cyclobacteriaceae bacterium]